ncbi:MULTISPECIES: hypothetical protein [Bacteroidota]|uniref:Uncharacterized membrane protein n=1 Tax=Epilithonimonas hungarica TaxID=454006 RepID=A0A1G7S7J5_9FLAO|nr:MULTISPECIES: hypothetical protein [Bacteroidota]SDG18953.1 Uncharacterized membrane protein [Epilithonimonas hungarica]
MEKLITIIFEAEEHAIEASKAMEQLAENKDIAVEELYILYRNEQGNIIIRDAQNQEIPQSVINTFVGGIIGILGGPLNVLWGLTNGAVAKRISNLLRYSKTSKMLERASKTITNGKTAIVAHIDEYWEIPLNMAMEPFNVAIKRLSIDEELGKYILWKQKAIEKKNIASKKKE